jgi:hypothetical protein
MSFIKQKYPYQNRSLKDIKGEQWNDIPEFDGAYQLSNFGRVKALRRWAEREHRGGYWVREKILASRIQVQYVSERKRKLYRLAAQISYNRKKYSLSIARLVYFLFVKYFDLKDRTIMISYRDGDPFNISPKNLVLTNPSASIAKAYKNNHHSLNLFGNVALPLSQYDLTGKKMGNFASISSASSASGIKPTSISTALKRKDGYGAGYIWRTGNKNKQSIKIPVSVKKILEAKMLRTSIITQYDLKGKKIREFNNLAGAAKTVNKQPNCIRLILLGKAFTCANSYWKLGKGPPTIDIKPILDQKLEKLRKSLCRSVTQFDLNGKKIRTYRSLADAARFMGVNSMSIHSAMTTGKSYTCRGFFWRYT